MFALEQVCRLTGVRRGDLVAWIEERWVLPHVQGGEHWFSEADVARVRLIVELRRDLRIQTDTLPVVLSLLDQVYSLRRALRGVCGALQDLPEPARQLVEARLMGEEEAPGEIRVDTPGQARPAG